MVDGAGRPLATVLVLLALVHLAQPLMKLVVAMAVLATLAALAALLVLPPLLAVGYALEHGFRRLGLHLPDPGALRRRVRQHVLVPMLAEV